MADALINPTLLNWAIERSGLERGEVAARLNVRDGRLDEWLSGDRLPTFKQAANFAKAVAVPFGFLYLNEPPADDIPIPDFRTVSGKTAKIDPNTRDLLQDIQFKREWFESFRKKIGYEPLDFVGRHSINDDATLIAQNMRSELSRIDDELFAGNLGWEGYLTRLMQASETIGIWVMRSGIVKNNTRRSLSVQAFRGFAISDAMLPIIFINGKDATAAQIFTIAHELAHIWLGSTDINTVELGKEDLGADGATEKKCNKIAAEFLAPSDAFKQAWITQLDLDEQVDALARKFSISRVVASRRAYDLNLITREEFSAFYALESQRWLSTKKSSGGDFYKTVPVRNGRNFTETVVSEALRGNMLLREASKLLGVKPAKLKELRASV